MSIQPYPSPAQAILPFSFSRTVKCFIFLFYSTTILLNNNTDLFLFPENNAVFYPFDNNSNPLLLFLKNKAKFCFAISGAFCSSPDGTVLTRPLMMGEYVWREEGQVGGQHNILRLSTSGRVQPGGRGGREGGVPKVGVPE